MAGQPIIDVGDVDADPIEQFRRWYDEAVEATADRAAAMTLATVGADGQPSARIVLLRGFDARGFVLYTSYESRKAAELDAGGRAALVFHWDVLDRQVRVEGRVERVASEESDAYFARRPRGHQLGAWASPQSAVIAGRGVLADRLADVERRFAGDAVPRPPHWGGYRVVPAAVELWVNRADRLHDRLRYSRVDPAGPWAIERLAP